MLELKGRESNLLWMFMVDLALPVFTLRQKQQTVPTTIVMRRTVDAEIAVIMTVLLSIAPVVVEVPTATSMGQK